MVGTPFNPLHFSFRLPELPLFLGRSWDQPDLQILPDPRKLSDLSTYVPSAATSWPRTPASLVTGSPRSCLLPAAEQSLQRAHLTLPLLLLAQWLPRGGKSPSQPEACQVCPLTILPPSTHRAHPTGSVWAASSHHPARALYTSVPARMPQDLISMPPPLTQPSPPPSPPDILYFFIIFITHHS